MKTIRQIFAFFCALLFAVTLLSPAQAGSWQLNYYEVEVFSHNEEHTVKPPIRYNDPPSEKVKVHGGYHPVTQNELPTPTQTKYNLAPNYPDGGATVIDVGASIGYNGAGLKGTGGKAEIRLSVTPIFRWDGEGSPIKTIIYKEVAGAALFRSHGSYELGLGGSDYHFDSNNHRAPYEGTHFDISYGSPWNEKLKDWNHDNHYDHYPAAAYMRADGLADKSYLTKMSADGRSARGETRSFSLSANCGGITLGENHYSGLGASLRLRYQAQMANFSLDLSAPDSRYRNSDPWNRELDAYASRAILGGALDSTPESTIESLWVGGVGYGANLSSNVMSHFGDIKYDWDSSSPTLTSQHFPYGRDTSTWPKETFNRPILEVPDEEWIYKSTRTKSLFHDLGDGDKLTDTTVELTITDEEEPESELKAKAKVNWYQQPATSFTVEVETVGIDLETGAEVSLDSGGEYSSEEAYYAMKEELKGTINGGSEIAGTVLEVAGDLITPDLYDAAIPVAGAAGKRIYKFSKGAFRIAAVTSRVRGLLSSNSAKLMATARARLGKGPNGPVLIRIRTKETITGQRGKLPPNSSREKLPDDRVKKKTTYLGQFCFVPGTLVDTQHGKRVIESLKIGDLVWAKDESTGEIALKPIVQTFERVAPSTLALTFSNGEIIETTIEHPFYVQDRGFVPAGLVALGNSIVTRAGPSLEVTAIEKHEAAHKVYNFEVADYHTYFVGESALWVHNANYTKFPNKLPDQLENELRKAREAGAKFISAGSGSWWDDLNDAASSRSIIKWGVGEDGQLRLMKRTVHADGSEISHAALMNGQDVIAAGEASLVKIGNRLYLSRISGHTGHYYDAAQTNFNRIMEARGEAAFRQYGIEMVP